ncbi:unnamed protein product [Schistosoma haematobium]|nr:unnamed protein product [Schistosoma haematobium]
MLFSLLSKRQKIFVLVISVACVAVVGIALLVHFLKRNSYEEASSPLTSETSSGVERATETEEASSPLTSETSSGVERATETEEASSPLTSETSSGVERATETEEASSPLTSETSSGVERATETEEASSPLTSETSSGVERATETEEASSPLTSETSSGVERATETEEASSPLTSETSSGVERATETEEASSPLTSETSSGVERATETEEASSPLTSETSSGVERATETEEASSPLTSETSSGVERATETEEASSPLTSETSSGVERATETEEASSPLTSETSSGVERATETEEASSPLTSETSSGVERATETGILCIYYNCSTNNSNDSINAICDNYEKYTCDKHHKTDHPDNLTITVDDVVMKMFEITEYQDVPSIKAAEMFYKTCTEALSVKNEFITTKVIDLIELLFSGWLMSSDDTQQYNLIEKFLRSRKFNLTASILPLIFQGGRTTLFSLNLIGDYSQEDNSMIYSDRMDSEVKEQIFKYLENVGALQTNKNMMDGVFEIYSKIKDIDWNVLFENAFAHESYKNLEVYIQRKEALRMTCKFLFSKIITEKGRKDIHNMLVIKFLYKMRRYLKKYVEDFYPSDIDEKSSTCIQELKENFWWTINKQHKYSSISKSTKDEVTQMFDKMKHKLTELLSQGSWSSEDDKEEAISTVSNIKVLLMDSESLSEGYESRDKILENKLSSDNYLINAYYSMKAKFLTSLKATSHGYELPDLFTFQPFIIDGGGTVVMTSGLLHPPFLNTSHSISEKYGTLGWLLGRQIISAAFRDNQLIEQTQYQPECGSTASTPFRSQLCCLSAQINSGRLQKETYKETLSGNTESLNERKMFFSAFARMMCGGLLSHIIDRKSQSSIQDYEYIVNDVVKYSQGFSETYQCESGSVMNPVRKCIL